MREKTLEILNNVRTGELSPLKANSELCDLFSVMPSLNIDIRPKAQEHLEGYYGSNDSRAFKENHIDHYIQGYKQAEKDIMKMHNEA